MGIIIIAVVIPLVVTFAILWYVRSHVFGMSKEKQAQAQQLVATGSKARARILQIRPTGMIVNEINIQCMVTFQLEPIHGGAPFPGEKKMMINQTQMPRVGDVWPAWYDAADPTQFAVGMPDGASPDQIPIFREFGIPHPLDASTGAAGGGSHVAELERLAQLRRDGALTEAEFQAEKAKLMGA
jgi:Protein of unknown function (DUF3592)/Short C-terminal domain